MKIRTEQGRCIDVFIEGQQFSAIWLGVGKQDLVGFSQAQLHDADLAVTHVETITGVQLQVEGPEDIYAAWGRIVHKLEDEFKTRTMAKASPRPARHAASG